MREQWKPISTHPNYEVSSLGQVRNARTKRLLKAFPNREGYLRLQLGDRKNHAVHILVAEAFIPNPEGKPEVNHKRGKKSDNRASQLEWATKSENITHSFSLRRKASKRRAIVAVLSSGGQQVLPSMAAAVRLGLATNVYGVHACCHGKAQTHNGHSFRFGD